MVAGVFAERQQFAAVGVSAATRVHFPWFREPEQAQHQPWQKEEDRITPRLSPAVTSSWWISSNHLQNLPLASCS